MSQKGKTVIWNVNKMNIFHAYITTKLGLFEFARLLKYAQNSFQEETEHAKLQSKRQFSEKIMKIMKNGN